MLTLLIGDAREQLATLPDACAHCVVTSPPYWNLRDYGVSGQIGTEATPEEFIAAMIDVFRGVRRVLRDDGTLWLNLGDTYANDVKGPKGQDKSTLADIGEHQERATPRTQKAYRNSALAIKRKDLCGMPWRVALALQADGWYLRQDVIWHKPSPMPESVTDRCTKAHEYVFLLTKSERYFFDAAAIAEPAVRYGTVPTIADMPRGDNQDRSMGLVRSGTRSCADQTRNCRSVWTMSSEPYTGAHFATFPSKLPERCILAGTSAMGCCAACGAPHARQTQRKKLTRERPNELTKRTGEDGTGNHCANTVAGVAVETTGWQPSCDCAAAAIPCTVLDPFFGAGTTGLMALRMQRRAIGIELNPEYAAMARSRIESEFGLLMAT